MKPTLFLLIGILLIGCTRTEYINNTITINRTINNTQYINVTIKEPCNLTFSKEREMELIRRLKFLEGRQDELIINETECIGNNTVSNYEGKLEMYERDIEELEDELENCTEELCRWNSTRC